MNSRNKFIVVVVLMLVAVLFIEYRMPRRFQWNPTYSHKDAQPFGCMVFDSIMAQTMPCGYTVVEKTLWQMQRDSMLNEPHGIVILSTENLEPDLLETILTLVEQGHVVLVGASINMYEWEDTLGLQIVWNSSFDIRYIAGKRFAKRPVRWVDTDGYPADTSLCRVYDSMINNIVIPNDSSSFKLLATYDDGYYSVKESKDSAAIAISMSKGKGELILLSAPLLMTNYAILDYDNGAVLIHRLMNRMKHLPVIRTEAYISEEAGEKESPFYVLLERAPFRWALYLAFIGIVFYCIFTARRRQRPIPVITQPQNGNLEFVCLIGTLFWQEGNHQGLLKRKLTYTAEEIHRQTGLDIMDGDSEKETIAQLARLTGMDPDNLRVVIRNVKEAADTSYRIVTAAEVKALIAELDKIVSNI
ncbi:MAG: DUF4350 domain-containing protein [Prevotella sp.]|nr:DUF4350 domain-containing protein [Prevotella sp.]